MKQERRRSPRRKTSYYVPLVEVETGVILGHLIDITGKGMMIDSKKEVPVGKSVRVRLDTTSDVADVSYIEFVIRSKWCRNDPIEPYLFNVGFEITESSIHVSDVLQRIAERYGS
jgi:hypothetical protein